MRVTKKAKEKYVKHCHTSWTKCKDEIEVEMKIKRMADLGRLHKINDDGSSVVRYYDLNLHIKNGAIINIWKDVYDKKVIVSEKEKKKWDRWYKRQQFKQKLIGLVSMVGLVKN